MTIMPELPEVETIRLQLERKLPGLTVKNISVRTAKSFHGNPKSLTGKKITGLKRFGKVLVIDFSGNLSVAIHLKLTGRMVYQEKDKKAAGWDVNYPTDLHTRVIFEFTSGDHLYFHDVRMFGWMQLFPSDKADRMPYLSKLGPEILKDVKEEELKKIFSKGNRPVKIILMDQEKVAGIGNIYANESLWCAKINPKTKANKLLNGQIVKLFKCLEAILKQAIRWKGASDNNYRDAFGQKGEVQEHFNVYSRENTPCPRCRSLIKRFVLGGRGTFFCPSCQPL